MRIRTVLVLIMIGIAPAISVLAAAAEATSSGNGPSLSPITWLPIIISVVGMVLGLFITRREVEYRCDGLDRRVTVIEAKPIASPDELREARDRAERAFHMADDKIRQVEVTVVAGKDALRSEFTRQIGDVHEKVNRIGNDVSGVQTETRLQTKKLGDIESALLSLLRRDSHQ